MFLHSNLTKSLFGISQVINRNILSSLMKTTSLTKTQICSFSNENKDEHFREFADLSKIDKRSFSNLSRDEQIAKIDEALK